MNLRSRDFYNTFHYKFAIVIYFIETNNKVYERRM